MSNFVNISNESCNLKQKSKFRQNIFTLLLLSFSGSVIYGLPYFRLYYYDAYKEIYSLTNEQMGLLGSAYGVLGLLSYLLGGILADKLQAKKLLVFSMLATGALGFVHLLVDNFYILITIYAVWGFTSLLTFWPACVKVVSSLANDDEQSRAFGLFEGGRGAFSAFDLAITTAIFAFFMAKALPALGIKYIIIFYSSTPILCAILLLILLKDGKEYTKPEKFTLKDVLDVIKMPAVWLASSITFCSYTFNLSFYYFTPFASNALGISATSAAIITVLHQYTRPFAAPSGGFLADKFGKAQMMIVGFMFCLIGVVAFLFFANMGAHKLVFCICAIVVAAGMYINYGIYMSLLKEGGVSYKQLGVAVGVACTIGYLPEILVPYIAGIIFDKYGNDGYFMYYKIVLGVGIVGILLCLLWIKYFSNKKDKK